MSDLVARDNALPDQIITRFADLIERGKRFGGEEISIPPATCIGKAFRLTLFPGPVKFSV